MTEAEPTSPAENAPASPAAHAEATPTAATTVESHIPYTVSSPMSTASHTLTTTQLGTNYTLCPSRVTGTAISQLPTLYLPPIHYTYDRATGKLVQIGQGGKGPMLSPTMPTTTNLGNNVTYAPGAFSQNAETKTTVQPQYVTSASPQLTQTLGQPCTQYISQMPRTVDATTDGNGAMPQVPLYDMPYQTKTYVRSVPSTGRVVPGMTSYRTQYVSNGAYAVPQGMVLDGAQHVRTQNMGLVTQPTFDGTTSMYVHPPQGVAHPEGARHVPAGVNAFATSMQNTYDKAASVFRSFDNMSVGSVAESIKNVLHPGSAEFSKAAIFRLQRLENVPINNNLGTKVAYNLVAYFDPESEQYGVYKSPKRWALPGDRENLACCDLQGDIIKIPWNGEQYVYLKVVENINQLETVVGRLKLHLESLVRQHPLRVNIISDANVLCGSVILEFNLGHMTQQEVRDKQDETLRSAEMRRTMEHQFRSNRMPDYDTYLKQHKFMQRNEMAAEYAPAKQLPKQRPAPPSIGDVQIPAALNHFVRWCCDITDSDLY
ncbi:hypothetical protein BgAZ_401240 [Babesia gibsoni]|uniref:Uncharacterized protein n=1 Tax=Babesia gibsoni TaxID=33632 RepID=A0AAD8LH49_BABGI|nr:hypothetical protein BgAZ_401240 [Babesia gibsoni]